jgi:CHAT domain-containing protein
VVEADGPSTNREGSVLAVGDVNYYRREEPVEPRPAGVAGSYSRSRLGDTWQPLPATRVELQSLRGLHDEVLGWKRRFDLLEASAATEEAVRQALPGHRYVHLATHGYFEPDHLPSLMANAREQDTEILDEERRAVGLFPGLLSGLVLAGVNAEPDPARDDGYLSAEELQYLDLSACDLAVLSACETALGSKRAGEGLQSLRRGFAVAGARTVVSSLWKVDDREAATFMRHFYENYWQKGLDKLEALHQAGLRMLRQNRADYAGDARPETWGAFVMSGDWR